MAGFTEMKEPEQAFLRMAIYGFSGTAKTPTAAKIAIGLAKHIGADKVAFFDTESQGADFVLPLFKAAGVKLFVRKSRAFSELLACMREIQGDIPILIVDSLTLIWKELQDTYCKVKNVRDIEFQHWRTLKGPGYWQDYVDEFLSAPMHNIAVGRAGNVYEDKENARTHKMQKVLVDSKMKAEKEFQFEPSLVIEMMRNPDTGICEAYVDRDRLISPANLTGKTFPNPDFKDFLPHINFLKIGGKHVAGDRATSERIIDNDAEDKFKFDERRRREIALDEIKSYMTKIAPGQTGPEKAIKSAIIELSLGTPSWAKVETLAQEKLDRASRLIRTLSDRGPHTTVDAIKTAWKLIEAEEVGKVEDDIPFGNPAPTPVEITPDKTKLADDIELSCKDFFISDADKLAIIKQCNPEADCVFDLSLDQMKLMQKKVREGKK